MAYDLGICLDRMEDICIRAGRLKKQLEFDKIRVVRRMDTLEQRNIQNDQQQGVKDGGEAHRSCCHPNDG